MATEDANHVVHYNWVSKSLKY